MSDYWIINIIEKNKFIYKMIFICFFQIHCITGYIATYMILYFTISATPVVLILLMCMHANYYIAYKLFIPHSLHFQVMLTYWMSTVLRWMIHSENHARFSSLLNWTIPFLSQCQCMVAVSIWAMSMWYRLRFIQPMAAILKVI